MTSALFVLADFSVLRSVDAGLWDECGDLWTPAASIPFEFTSVACESVPRDTDAQPPFSVTPEVSQVARHAKMLADFAWFFLRM